MSDERQPTARKVGPARIRPMDRRVEDDLSASTTVQERLAMVDLLSRRMWELTGRPRPTYTRDQIPVTIARMA